MGDRFKTLRRSAPSADPENPFQNFPGQIQDTASFNFKAILKKADRENFLNHVCVGLWYTIEER